MSAVAPSLEPKKQPDLPIDDDDNLENLSKAKDWDPPPPYSPPENLAPKDSAQQAAQSKVLGQLLDSLTTLLPAISLEKAPAHLEIKQVFQQLISGLQQFIPIDTNTDNSPILEKLCTCFTNNREKILLLLDSPTHSKIEALVKQQVTKLYQAIKTTLGGDLQGSEKEEKDVSPPMTLNTFKKHVWNSFILLFKIQLLLEKESSPQCIMQMLENIDQRSLQLKREAPSPAVDLPLKAEENEKAVKYYLGILPLLIEIPQAAREQVRLDEIFRPQQLKRLESESSEPGPREAAKQDQKNKQKTEEGEKSAAHAKQEETARRLKVAEKALEKRKEEARKVLQEQEAARVAKAAQTLERQRLRLEQEKAKREAENREAAQQQAENRLKKEETEKREARSAQLRKMQDATRLGQQTIRKLNLDNNQDPKARPKAFVPPSTLAVKLPEFSSPSKPAKKAKDSYKNIDRDRDRKDNFFKKLKKIRLPFDLLLLLPLLLGISSAAAVYFYPVAVIKFSLFGLTGPLLPALLIGLMVAISVSIALGLHRKGPLHRYSIKRPISSAVVTSFALIESGCLLLGGLLAPIKGFMLLGSSVLPLGLVGLGLVLLIGLGVWLQTRQKTSRKKAGNFSFAPAPYGGRPAPAASFSEKLNKAFGFSARSSGPREHKAGRKNRPQ